MNPSATLFAGRQNIGSEVEISTIEKQRKELQLLIGELKDRDKELNDMVAVHQRQLLSWEEDRQKVLTLEERCSKLEGQKYISSISSTLLYASILKGLTGELHKRTEIIRSLTKKVKTLESNQTEYQAALQKTQLQLQEMAQKATHSSLLSEDLEARNENLSNTLVELSAQVGQLQAREQALTTMIKLKDKDIIEAVNHIADCSGKFKLLEHALRDAKMVETCIVKEKQDYKQKLKALKIEVSKLKEDLNEKTTENNEQREEIIRLKQEKSCLHDELVFTDLLEKQKSWSLGGKMPMEAENKSTFCKIHAKSPKGNGIEIQNEEKQLLETSMSLSDEKQWHDVNVYLGLASCSGAKQPEKLNVECQDDMERSGVSCCHKNEACLGESDIWESKCCHPSNFIIEAPGHMSDVEWMSIFKPSKVQRIVRHKSVCTCAESASGRKYNSSTSELFAIQHSHCLGASKSAAREDERLIETGPSPDTKNSPKILLFNKEAPLSNEKDDFSPTSKLQRLLAESRQMVTDLELSTLLPISSESFSSSANNNLEVSEESAQKNTLLTN
ncbi:coiled-coil domain-containing protein 62 isoform X7 [Herpailurus yagouaroundi]|uniref:coiled-coil domain-containing protein 62 isoform X7 n=1 Tax=Herpailurus yagouaroundi TaxID=1608482 RepID=UPI001AD6859D|nr:coiled-coil domain-containing protein 62 isoform X7 [Puma yagouaroundi]